MWVWASIKNREVINFLTSADPARLSVALLAWIAACLSVVRALLVVTLVGVRREPIAGLRPLVAHRPRLPRTRHRVLCRRRISTLRYS